MPISRVENKRSRSFIDQFNVHHGTEHSELNINTRVLKRFRDLIENRTRNLPRRRRGETRTTPLTSISEQRELADQKNRTADIQQRPVKARLPVYCAEDAKIDRLVHQIIDVRLLVIVVDTNEYDQTLFDLARRLIIDGYFGSARALDYESQLPKLQSV